MEKIDQQAVQTRTRWPENLRERSDSSFLSSDMQDNRCILSYSCRQPRSRFGEKLAFYRSEVWEQVCGSITPLQISADPVLGGLQSSSKEFVDDGVLAESLD
jgi:hypothetical protein